jgi:hypothetical protein
MLPHPQNYFGRPLLKSWLTPCLGVTLSLYNSVENAKLISINSSEISVISDTMLFKLSINSSEISVEWSLSTEGFQSILTRWGKNIPVHA